MTSTEDCKIIDIFNTLIETLGNVWGLWCLGIGIIVAIAALLNVVKRSRKYSEEQVNELCRNGKYIPGIFVELNSTKEWLRYFIYGKKWKSRLIKKYNFIYDNVYGKILKEGLLEDEITFHLSYFSTLSEIENAVVNASDIHNRFRTRNVNFKSEYQDSQYLFEIIHMPYEEAFQNILQSVRAAQSRYVVLTGSAGNGKTNMLCSITELLIRLKHGVVFLNARDIKEENIIDYILKALGIGEFWQNHKKAYYNIVDKLLLLRRKRFFIVIDAINENDMDDFGDRMKEFINFVSNYKSIKIIVSCRNEYYEERFKKVLVNEAALKAYECDLKGEPYSLNARPRIIARYKEFFNYTGNISLAVEDVLCEHLLLLRIFFETNKDSQEDANFVQKHEIFRAYIDYLKRNGLVHLEATIDAVMDEMLEQCCFDGVNRKKIVSSLKKTDISKEELDDMLDGNALVGKKLVHLPNSIGQSVEEQIYFVFDELRDYCLAQHIVKNNTVNDQVNTESILSELNLIRGRKLSCEEGLIHYLYVFFRAFDGFSDEESARNCNYILNYYRIPEGEINVFYAGKRHREEFINLGLKMICTMGLKLKSFEKEYIRDCLRKNPYEDGGKIFDVMLEGTISGGHLNLKEYVDILFGIGDKDAFLKAFQKMSSHGTFLAYEYPQDLEIWHRKLVDEEADEKAYQIQWIAELFLLCFKFNDYREQEKMERYFWLLPSHEKIQDEVSFSLHSAFGE